MESIKLSVTVRAALAAKYGPASLKKIDTAVKAWIAADKQRGIRTVHVALDDATEMAKFNVAPLKGNATPIRVKRIIDLLWKQLGPDYLVLFGSDDIVPMFEVANPSFHLDGDDDVRVPTDNPYASSKPFNSSKRSSYLIPDRVVGRIPDMIDDSDPAWFTTYLTTATKWTSKPASTYDGTYAICCDEWKQAGADCVKHISAPASSLFISPPRSDTYKPAQTRLGSRVHMIKCHGSPLDPKFYGQRGDNEWPTALTSATLRPRVKPDTLAAAMCCYGAQVFSPADPGATDPGEWPLSSTYLRGGALAFVGSTMVAWVGDTAMVCADWIVAGYLKSVLGGASTGRAMLEAKQDYVQWLNQQGLTPDKADEKTLVEFVLLGDPSVHPVRAARAPAAVPAAHGTAHAARATIAAFVPPLAVVEERHQRRLVRAQMADRITKLLPLRVSRTKNSGGPADAVLTRAMAFMGKKDVQVCRTLVKATAKAEVDELETPLPSIAPAVPGRAVMAGMRRTTAKRSLEYYWTGRRIREGHKQIQLVKVETDLEGRILRTVVLHSS